MNCKGYKEYLSFQRDLRIVVHHLKEGQSLAIKFVVALNYNLT